ncbi:recombinase family protein [Rhizobium mesoamericanum]|uniref:Site-specific recombinase n=1 Tax=Rhizobium mesoamericanum STM3625 TaxID=1211777 RepID=K0Q1A1_9HYPH|nr:recombinase family protein [Rhizobium mesoamericanum]CCM78040.1 Site-specific recombinase [Rhizobium mesoamericanum STM3625]
MRKYVSYRRVSTEEQGKSGLGLEAQQRDIDLFLANYSEVPYEVVGEFVEEASGADGDRPELAKALDLVRKTGAELLVAKLDRLSRKMSFISGLMDDRKVKLRVASMPHADKFQLHIYAALAEQEREFISKRTKDALAAAKARGVKLGGRRRKADGTWALDKRIEGLKTRADADAARVIGFIKPLRDAGKSLREIVTALDSAGLATARGGRWTAKQVSRVLERATD